MLHAQGLHKRFGGIQAVRDISLAVPRESIVAIIGPNGAGKSTLLNLMSGLYAPDAGSIIFDGNDIAGLPPHKRARLGLARTFQKIRLFRRLSVLDNVVAAFHIHHDIPSWQYLVHAGAFARDHARCRNKAMELLAFVGLAPRAAAPAASLPYGEHNMDLVMRIADHVIVMDYGQHLFAGTPAQVQANPLVIAAYLGG